MKKILIGLPIMTIYVYGIVILMQYGYNSYFDIPQNYIQASIVQNYVYSHQLFQVMMTFSSAINWWMWILIIIGFFALFTSYHSDYFWMWAIRICGILLLAGVLFGSYHFGQYVAQNTTIFYMPADDCSLSNNRTKYIIPSFYQDEAVLVAIDGNNVLKGEVMSKKLSDLDCGYIKKDVGIIKKN
jgi:hypothetical protein